MLVEMVTMLYYVFSNSSTRPHVDSTKGKVNSLSIDKLNCSLSYSKTAKIEEPILSRNVEA